MVESKPPSSVLAERVKSSGNHRAADRWMRLAAARLTPPRRHRY